jgi:hypothetical protein
MAVYMDTFRVERRALHGVLHFRLEKIGCFARESGSHFKAPKEGDEPSAYTSANCFYGVRVPFFECGCHVIHLGQVEGVESHGRTLYDLHQQRKRKL